MFPTTPTPATTRLLAEDIVQPIRPPAQVVDVLSEFAPGQKLLAQVQAQLANGAYRATIAQRDVTLALPFAAKAGDALELEVVETDGRVAFAVVPPRTAKPDLEGSASASISRTGLLISSLLGSSDEEAENKPPGVLLARGEPLSEKPPTKAADLAPLLQAAVAKSGLFYESHLAKWVTASQPAAVQLDEPQAALAPPAGSLPTPAGQPPANGAAARETPRLSAHTAALPSAFARADDEVAGQSRIPLQGVGVKPGEPPESMATAVRGAIPDEIAPLVQQQLNGLASNVYAFHGMAWPGQRIEWEIVDEDGHRGTADDDSPLPWKTRLHLSLPSLGAIDASLQLNGNTLTVHLQVPDGGTSRTLRQAAPQLQQQLAAAGLELHALQVEEKDVDDASGLAAA